MAYSVETRASNQANALRDALSEAEDLIVKPTAHTVERLLTLLDTIEQQIAELSQSAIDLRPEESRWNSLLSRISSKPEPVAAAAAAAGGMAKLRAQHPPADSFWWRIDKEVRRRRARMIRRAVLSIGSFVAVLALIYWAINFFFPPSEETLIMFDATAQIEQFASTQHWDDALKVIDQTKEQLPDNPELLLWETVMAERAGDQERAAASLARAHELLPGQTAEVWINLDQFRLQVGDLDGAEAAANRALEITSNHPQAVFLLASVAEFKGNYPLAIDLFQQTFDLAEDDDPQLAVIARVRMGSLLQRPFDSPLDNPTPTSSP